MTEYTSRRAKYESDPIVSLASARELTGLDLVASRDLHSYDGQSYHQMEEASESKSHHSARAQGIDFFSSIGYRIFPEGVGVRGTYTLSDFLAIRGTRIVFVEVLSDMNIKEETLRKKAQLQQHGELCFILFFGAKWSNREGLGAAKHSIESWADVLYCRLNRYNGDRIQQTYKATVSFDTTRRNGIRLELSFERVGRKLIVSVKFLTHLYENSPLPRACPAYLVESSSCYAEIFLEMFREWAVQTQCIVNSTSRFRPATSLRAMGRKSGLKMYELNGRERACLRFEHHGGALSRNIICVDDSPTSIQRPADIVASFVLQRADQEGLRRLLLAIQECGLTAEYSAAEFEQAMKLLPNLIRPIASEGAEIKLQGVTYRITRILKILSRG